MSHHGIRIMLSAGMITAALASSSAHAAPSVLTLHSFAGPGAADGTSPTGGVLLGAGVNGANIVYGTTPEGGAGGNGIVFALTPPKAPKTLWKETILTSFAGTTDGGVPFGSLIKGANGTLIGTTYGGTYGTVFTLTPPVPPATAWTRTVIFRFKAGSLSAAPFGGVVRDPATGYLYGSASQGGAFGHGTIFQLTPPASGSGEWTETILHSFQGQAAGDGDQPSSALIRSKKTLYGTTAAGGTAGQGTVFSQTLPNALVPHGHYKLLYAFQGDINGGGAPVGGLAIDTSGALYGTTAAGGNPAPNGGGTVFKLAAPAGGVGSWTRYTLHNFTDATDGSVPYAGLTLDGTGALWGMTTKGGGANAYGTLFKVTPAGVGGVNASFEVMHVFTDNQGPALPGLGGVVIDKAGRVYGSSQFGGVNGYGTIFRYQP